MSNIFLAQTNFRAFEKKPQYQSFVILIHHNHFFHSVVASFPNEFKKQSIKLFWKKSLELGYKTVLNLECTMIQTLYWDLLIFFSFFLSFVDREVDEHKTLKLKCPVGKDIYIRSAIYGHTKRGCGEPDKSKKIVSDRCESKRRCRVRASNNVFGDPCHGIFKYLKVGYICISKWESSACSLILHVFTLCFQSLWSHETNKTLNWSLRNFSSNFMW